MKQIVIVLALIGLMSGSVWSEDVKKTTTHETDYSVFFPKEEVVELLKKQVALLDESSIVRAVGFQPLYSPRDTSELGITLKWTVHHEKSKE